MTETGGRPRCTAQTHRGEPCQAFALPNGGRCAVHEPTRADRNRAARSKGGKVTAFRTRRRRLHTTTALIRFTSALLQDVLEGTVVTDVGRTVFYGVSIQRALVELAQSSDIERRLAALEERLANSGQTRSVPWSA